MKKDKKERKSKKGQTGTGERDASSLGAPSLLESIVSPVQLKDLTLPQLEQLAGEIRTYLVDQVGKTGGHLASNLGVVELTLALHTVFDTPRDHLIFDVGHQSYVHKILTGRRELFPTLRQGGGLSGFTKRAESEHDCFGAGHSSTSLSAALGFAEMDARTGNTDASTICVVGDGAFTGGMIHEALNNVKSGQRLIVVLNENEMSISKNIGHFATLLSRFRSRPGYFRAKRVTGRTIRRLPLIGKPLFRFMLRVKKSFKNMAYGSNYFEDMGLYYLGPADGHDLKTLISLFREAKAYGGSVVVHVKTQKGKGYSPAEENPSGYHGIRPGDAPTPDSPTYSKMVGQFLCDYAKEHSELSVVTAAMTEGTGLSAFREQYPGQFYDVGIAEEHAVTFCAGLRAAGSLPVFCVYSTFLQRSYDQLIHDCALQDLPLLLCVDRAGLNPSDGPTHHGIFDVSMLLDLPHVRIYTPLCEKDLRDSLRISLEEGLPAGDICAVRYSNSTVPSCVAGHFPAPEEGEPDFLRPDVSGPENPKAVLLSYGREISTVQKAACRLTEDGIPTLAVALMQIAPVEPLLSALKERYGSSALVLLVEEGIGQGGLGMTLKARMDPAVPFAYLAVRDPRVCAQKDRDILACAGIDEDAVVREVRQRVQCGHDQKT
ncbi:MAG: 1-deoxy-D-xylulose-5-phosphate synthase [Clostridia bacterium]|nr:1-deoxy-D-xylulose-5-phosphate synthase [Clostridia bacterium]